jgi:hypothetical protein
MRYKHMTALSSVCKDFYYRVQKTLEKLRINASITLDSIQTELFKSRTSKVQAIHLPSVSSKLFRNIFHKNDNVANDNTLNWIKGCTEIIYEK